MRLYSLKSFVLFFALCLTISANAVQRYGIDIQQTTTHRGELYQYAEKYLGTTDIITLDTTYYTIVRVKLLASRPTPQTNKSVEGRSQNRDVQTIVANTDPLLEDALRATTLADKAAAVAKQIYRIREARMYLLSGEIEHMPADGQSMQLMLQELKKEEKQLTGLFVGETTVRMLHEEVAVDIEDDKIDAKEVLWRFSAEKGLLPSYSTDGDPITLFVHRYMQRVLVESQPAKKKVEPTYMNRIFRSDFRISYLDQVLYTCTYNE